MPRYFFNVTGMQDTDDGGEELPDAKSARAHTLKAARELLSEAALVGWDCTDWTMVATDEAGRTVLTLRLGDTLTKHSVATLRPRSAPGLFPRLVSGTDALGRRCIGAR